MATLFDIDSRSLRIIYDQDTQLHSGCLFSAFFALLFYGCHRAWPLLARDWTYEQGVNLVSIGRRSGGKEIVTHEHH